MGMSATAYLWYGLDLGGRETSDWYETRGHPLVDIRDADGEEVYEGQPGYEDYDYPDLSTWLALQKGLEPGNYKEAAVLAKAAPVELEYYGYIDGMASYALVLKGVGGHAYDYGIEAIDELNLHVNQSLFETACKFCEVNNLPDFRQAKWLLAASYG